MILRMSSLFVRTLRDDPADAEVPSHRLLVRAGYIRRAAPGIYTWLPLGLRVLRKIENIIREEMDAIGAQELLFPALLPREPYEATGRWTEYGDGIFRLKDRKDADYLLGPTHEEMFTLVVKDLYSSYKDLPLAIYQIQNKYRDEARPRAGLLRGREFVMKDAYSFDIDDAGLDASYQKHRDAYIRIFDRLGFEYVIVKARPAPWAARSPRSSWPRPRSARTPTCAAPGCDYAANVEAVDTPAPAPARTTTTPAAHAEQTPDTPTIDTLVAHLDEKFPRDDRPWTAADTLKNVVFSVRHPDGTVEALAIGLPGDREVDAKRLEAKLGEGVVFEPFGEADFAARPMLAKGYIGPGALGEKKPAGVRYLLDPRVVEGTRWVTGADVSGSHVLDLVAGRDFSGDGIIDVAEVRDGDPCPVCGATDGGVLRVGARHRDGPHLPARPQVRRRARPPGARRERQARHRHHGLLRHRPLPCGRRDRRGHARRAGPVLAPQRRARRRTPGRHRQGRGGLRGRGPDRHRAVGRRRRGALRRPPARSAPA